MNGIGMVMYMNTDMMVYLQSEESRGGGAFRDKCPVSTNCMTLT